MSRNCTVYNSTYKKLAVQWLHEALCFVSSSVVVDSFRLRNRQLLVAAKRYGKSYYLRTIQLSKKMKLKSILLTTVATLGLTAATMAQNVPSYVPTNGLVGWWPFNGNANDESGNGNNGTVNGATLTTDRFGNLNKAYSFDGNDNIEIDNWNSIQGNSNFSVSCWVKQQ